MVFRDILYGRIDLPEWLQRFLRIPEFARLRGVRLSNVDSFEFKDFSGPSRWEHGIGVAHLAHRVAKRKNLPAKEMVELILAGLLHDVATPPFAHSAEYVLDNFDHEIETQRVLSGFAGSDTQPDRTVFASQVPQFNKACRALSRSLGASVDPGEVARAIVGDGEFGFLINGVLDLDNADNVTRACLYLGLNVRRDLPLYLADWLANQESTPTDIATVKAEAVQEWLYYRRWLYERFFTCSDEELGRQAFLHHLMRRAVRSGITRSRLIWQTDEEFLFSTQALGAEGSSLFAHPLNELVDRYRLLDNPTKIADISLYNKAELRSLTAPAATSWIEEEVSGPGLEAMVLVVARRHQAGEAQLTLFPKSIGSVLIFKLGSQVKRSQLPSWLKKEVPVHVRGKALASAVSVALGKHATRWAQAKPWAGYTPERKANVVTNLEDMGDWSFRLSRNDSIHPYPGTFVHSLPAALIIALGLRGELVLDPFGGTGQTAAEAIKYGGQAVTADSNTIATLVAEARFTYLPADDRAVLRKLKGFDFLEAEAAEPPPLSLVDRWFHPETLSELASLKGFIERENGGAAHALLRTCFSAILPQCTARRGEQHGYFADNSPLAKGESAAPYQGAVTLFEGRLKRNLDILERFYSQIEKTGRDPAVELEHARTMQVNVVGAGAASYGVEPGSVAGIVTSPPYLCMADYTLGSRLSYSWFFPTSLDVDFQVEIGARRTRFRPEEAKENYFKNLKAFAEVAATIIAPGGFVALVLGAPIAKAFKDVHVFDRVDSYLERSGFEGVWNRWRRIHWHRNHGYQRLSKERISVHMRL